MMVAASVWNCRLQAQGESILLPYRLRCLGFKIIIAINRKSEMRTILSSSLKQILLIDLYYGVSFSFAKRFSQDFMQTALSFCASPCHA